MGRLLDEASPLFGAVAVLVVCGLFGLAPRPGPSAPRPRKQAPASAAFYIKTKTLRGLPPFGPTLYFFSTFTGPLGLAGYLALPASIFFITSATARSSC